MLNGCSEDIKYEEKMIRENKTEVFEKNGYFKDRTNAYKYIAGASVLLASLYGATKKK